MDEQTKIITSMGIETFEEAAERLFTPAYTNYKVRRQGFIEGAKWQPEKSYSEEEVKNLLNEYNEYLFTFIDKDEVGIGVEKEDVLKWFEQFKINT